VPHFSRPPQPQRLVAAAWYKKRGPGCKPARRLAATLRHAKKQKEKE
jgi:hypothetical protein